MRATARCASQACGGECTAYGEGVGQDATDQIHETRPGNHPMTAWAMQGDPRALIPP